MRLLHDRTNGHSCQRHSHRQGIDEHPQDTVRLRPTEHAARQDAAKHHISTPAASAHYQRPYDMKDRRGTHTEHTRGLRYAVSKPLRQLTCALIKVETATVHVDQAERNGGLVDIR